MYIKERKKKFKIFLKSHIQEKHFKFPNKALCGLDTFFQSLLSRNPFDLLEEDVLQQFGQTEDRFTKSKCLNEVHIFFLNFIFSIFKLLFCYCLKEFFIYLYFVLHLVRKLAVSESKKMF